MTRSTVRSICATPSVARAGLGHHEGPVGREEPVDGEQPERGRTVDEHHVEVDALEREAQPVLRTERIEGEPRLARDARAWARGAPPWAVRTPARAGPPRREHASAA